MAEERLQRALARARVRVAAILRGAHRRREGEVNGTVATLGDKVDTAVDVVAVRGAAVNLDPNVRYFALHKPAGVITTMRDRNGRPDMRDSCPPRDPGSSRSGGSTATARGSCCSRTTATSPQRCCTRATGSSRSTWSRSTGTTGREAPGLAARAGSSSTTARATGEDRAGRGRARRTRAARPRDDRGAQARGSTDAGGGRAAGDEAAARPDRARCGSGGSRRAPSVSSTPEELMALSRR